MARSKDENKEEAIFRATLKVVLERGFSGMKMSEVAREASIATGTLYLYFQDKDDLINRLYLHLKKIQAQRYLEGYAADAPFLPGFRTIWFQVFRQSLHNPEESAFLEQYYRSPFLREEVRSASRSMLQPIYDLLDRGKAELLIKPIHNEVLLAQLIGPIHELVRLHREGDFPLLDEHIESAFQMAWDAVKA